MLKPGCIDAKVSPEQQCHFLCTKLGRIADIIVLAQWKEGVISEFH